jgi:hypothetical protein
VEANTLDHDHQGHAVPFRYLHVIVDSQRELGDVDEFNNGAVLDRREIPSVDPTIFRAKVDETAGGRVIDIAGEGLGPEPGQVVVNLQDFAMEVDPEILGWFDMGIQVRLPAFAPGEPWAAFITVVRGDGAASNPLPVTLRTSHAASPKTNP